MRLYETPSSLRKLIRNLDSTPQKELVNVIHVLIKMGAGFGKLKKIYSKILTKINKDKPIDITYHGIKVRLYPHNNTIESKILVSSRLREGKELRSFQAL